MKMRQRKAKLMAKRIFVRDEDMRIMKLTIPLPKYEVVNRLLKEFLRDHPNITLKGLDGAVALTQPIDSSDALLKFAHDYWYAMSYGNRLNPKT